MEVSVVNNTHVFELAVNSASRDLVVDKDSETFEVIMKRNPIKSVTKLSLVDTHIPKLKSNVTNVSMVQFTWFDITGLNLVDGGYPVPADLSTRYTDIVNIDVLNNELPFHDIYEIMAYLSTFMSTRDVVTTVAWSTFGDRVKITSTHQLVLWPLAPKPSSSVDSYETWDYVSKSLFRALGFDVSAGPVVIRPNIPFVTPYAYNLKGPSYTLLKLYANGQSIGRIWELDAGGTRVGPYFARIRLTSSDDCEMCVCDDYKFVDHVFGSPTTISKLVFQLDQPIIGLSPQLYKMFGRDWIANLRIEQSTRNVIQHDNESYIEFNSEPSSDEIDM